MHTTTDNSEAIFQAAFDRLDELLPEFELRRKNGHWRSASTLKADGTDGQSKGAVSIHAARPGILKDFRADSARNLASYLADSHFHPSVTSYREALEYLAAGVPTALQSIPARAPANAAAHQAATERIELEAVERMNNPHAIRSNALALALADRYGAATWQVLDRYGFGAGEELGASLAFFVYHDRQGRPLKAKAVPYDRNGKRVKTHPRPVVQYPANAESSLYGLQLLDQQPEALVCLVESEKTAIVATLQSQLEGIADKLLFLAIGGANGLTSSMARELAGREVLILPDADQSGQYGAYAAQDKLTTAGAEANIAPLSQVFPECDTPVGSDLADLLGF